MNSESAHMVAALKIPMLKPGEYELWRMRIEQYIQMIDYLLWDVIEKGATFPKFQTVAGVTSECDNRFHIDAEVFFIFGELNRNCSGKPVGDIESLFKVDPIITTIMVPSSSSNKAKEPVGAKSDYLEAPYRNKSLKEPSGMDMSNITRNQSKTDTRTDE
ncbi:hypothetical protein Tco_0583868 [Tanacetum coccineum]